jgi:hypothetical protein
LTKPLSRRSVSRRRRLEDAIEKAIALLDEIDGDPDLEPSLSCTVRRFIDSDDLEHEDRNRPPKGYMHPEDLVSQA